MKVLIKLYLDSIKNSFVIKNPLLIYEAKAQKLDLINENIHKLINYKLEKYETKLEQIKTNPIIISPNKIFEKYDLNLSILINKLELLNPLNTLKRGYSLSYINGEVLKNIKNVHTNDEIKIKLVDRIIDAKVNNVEEKNEIF